MTRESNLTLSPVEDSHPEAAASGHTPWATPIPRRTFLCSVLATAPFFRELVCPAVSAGAHPRVDSPLELEVESYIKSLRRSGRIESQERTAWSVYDFTTGKKLVAINEDVPYQSASMIKPFVALAYFYKRRENPGGFPYGGKTRVKMRQMIQDSSNPATNYFIDFLNARCGRFGPRTLELILKNRAPGIFKQLRIVERIPSGGRSYGNKASAHDYSRFLYALWKRRFPDSDELLRLMGLPNSDRLFRGAKAIPHGTEVYDKTGTTAKMCGDMGILVARGRNGKSYPYTLIGIIERRTRARSLGRWTGSRGDVIREVSNIVYRYQKRVHNLR
jgi:beta-lactamase class A